MSSAYLFQPAQVLFAFHSSRYLQMLRVLSPFRPAQHRRCCHWYPYHSHKQWHPLEEGTQARPLNMVRKIRAWMLEANKGAKMKAIPRVLGCGLWKVSRQVVWVRKPVTVASTQSFFKRRGSTFGGGQEDHHEYMKKKRKKRLIQEGTPIAHTSPAMVNLASWCAVAIN